MLKLNVLKSSLTASLMKVLMMFPSRLCLPMSNIFSVPLIIINALLLILIQSQLLILNFVCILLLKRRLLLLPFNADPTFGFGLAEDELHDHVYMKEIAAKSCASTIFNNLKASHKKLRGVFITHLNGNPVTDWNMDS
jgi:hypothetical protein